MKMPIQGDRNPFKDVAEFWDVLAAMILGALAISCLTAHLTLGWPLWPVFALAGLWVLAHILLVALRIRRARRSPDQLIWDDH